MLIVSERPCDKFTVINEQDVRHTSCNTSNDVASKVAGVHIYSFFLVIFRKDTADMPSEYWL